MRIVNPTFGTASASGEQVGIASVDWQRDPIVLFSNSKPNARELLEGVQDRVGLAAGNVEFVYKDSASQPAPAHLYDEVASRYKGALLAIAD